MNTFQSDRGAQLVLTNRSEGENSCSYFPAVVWANTLIKKFELATKIAKTRIFMLNYTPSKYTQSRTHKGINSKDCILICFSAAG